LKITVLLGGASAERNVSIASGLRIAAALRSRGHQVTCLDPTGSALSSDEEKRLGSAAVGATPPTPDELAALQQRLKPSFAERPEVRDADVVFIGLHGGSGEDGTIQSLLEMAGVPYTGSGPMASAIAMDKDVSKILFRAADVQTADWMMAPRSPDAGWLQGALRTIGLPLIVKPSKQGSTVGLTVVKQEAQLAPAIAEAFRYDDEVMVERFVAGRELTVGVIGSEAGGTPADALPVGEIIPKHEIYDYECKYTAGMATEVFPADLPARVAARCQEMAVRAFGALKLRGVARIDFRLDAQGEPWCLEANTLPGMTDLSLIPQGAAAAGIPFDQFCERIARLALDGRDSGTGVAQQDRAGR
jgi:D-alanine-D-alanine ligase